MARSARAARRARGYVASLGASVSLNALGLSLTSFTVGTAANGTITGATAGSTITASGLPAGFTINGAARTFAYDGSGSAGTPSVGLAEALASAANSPRASSVALTIAAAPVTGPTIAAPPNWDYIGYGDSRTDNALYATYGTSGYSTTNGQLGPAGPLGQPTGNRLRLGRYPNFGISNSTTLNGAAIPRKPAGTGAATANTNAAYPSQPTWFRGLDSTNKGIDYAAAHPAGIVLLFHGGADVDGDLPSAARDRFLSYITYLKANAPNKLVIVLAEPPFGVNQAGTLVESSTQAKKDFSDWQKTLDFASGSPNAQSNVIVIDLWGLMVDPAYTTAPYRNKQGYYRDGRHLTYWGSLKIGELAHQRLTAVYGATYTNLPAQIVLPTSNGANIAADTIGVHSGFAHTNPLMTPGANGSVIGSNFKTSPGAANIPQAWTMDFPSGSMGSGIDITASKTGTDPDGYPMTTIGFSGTLYGATFTASCSGNTLTVETMQPGGTIVVGARIIINGSVYAITALGTGTGGTGTYTLSGSVTVASGTTLVANTSWGAGLYTTAVASGQIALTDKVRPVGRVVPRTGSVGLRNTRLSGYVRDATSASATSQESRAGVGAQPGLDIIGYLINANGFDAAALDAIKTPLVGQMLDLSEPNMTTANGGGGILTANPPVAAARVDMEFDNYTGSNLAISAMVDISRVGLARVSG